MIDLTAIILTKNEEKNLQECIDSVREVAKRIVVVDSYSTDDTLKIAEANGADIYQHPFENYGKQFQWAMDHTDIDTKWIFRFDADERLTMESAKELEKLCTDNDEIGRAHV